jgi:hypothetical protein
MTERVSISDIALGKCPECFEFSTFIPTRKKDIFICEECDQKVRQYKNGKIHWVKYNDKHTFKAFYEK